MSSSKSYMIAPQQTIRVKLGRSVSPEKRRNTLQTGSSDRLLLLADSDTIHEIELHHEFKEYRQGDGGTEFFNLPLDKFLILFLRYYDQDPERIKSCLIPKEEMWTKVGPVTTLSNNTNIDIDWDRVSGGRTVRGQTNFYTVKQLQEYASQLGINSSGLKKKELADEILKHKPGTSTQTGSETPQIQLSSVRVSKPTKVPVPVIEQKGLISSLYKTIFG
jgi:hypothetical protein